ncbi:hypothetical protein FD754_010932 [Muntiacus muntjak]|uniref:Myb-like domain-containing protein n=1 Tax=Muntiacus muntjak TaxID=9888 RepID=A0A5N3X2Y1_MUNMU|nr:hypothetical protein FD754_010932 [Muntiacus muntjak]
MLWGPEAEEGWTSREEQLLLDAIEQFGFGNWEDMAAHVVGGPLSPSLTTPLPPLDISVAEQQQLGHMPLRDDYEIEYDQDAETLIGGLSVNYNDDDMARSTTMTTMTRRRRSGRREVTKEEKELRLKLRPLYQFMSCKELDNLLENMHKEKMLRTKIRELQHYWRNGITKMEESAEYEAARHKCEKRKENKVAAAVATAAGGAKRGKEGRDGEFAAIEHLPGFELLSDLEKVLCSSLNLRPARYVTVKTIIIKNHLQKHQGIPSKSRLPSYLDKVLQKRIRTSSKRVGGYPGTPPEARRPECPGWMTDGRMEGGRESHRQ